MFDWNTSREGLSLIHILELSLSEAKNSKSQNFTIKQLESSKKKLEARLEKLMDAKEKDDTVTFEQLGVDRLFVDEADEFKNLGLFTKMRNVEMCIRDSPCSARLSRSNSRMGQGNKSRIHPAGRYKA